jgi:hypothetical protein
MNPVPYNASGITVKPPANDGQSGFILSKQLDYHGRPISFVFVGNTAIQNGQNVHLDAALLRRSLNYSLLRRGHVYPLFYDSLYDDLREPMRQAAMLAWYSGLGLWPYDWSNEWVDISNASGIEEEYTIFPKLFRRLVDFLKTPGPVTQAAFAQWLNDNDENDLVLLRPEVNRTHLDNIIEIQNGRIRMTRYTEDLVFISRT